MPYMETPPRAPSESGEVSAPSESREVSAALRARNVADEFLADAPPHARDIDLDFSVVFHEIHRYKVTIKLYEHGTEDIVPWATPIPKVSVTYRTESRQTPSGESIQLQFVHEQEGYAAFFERDLNFQWGQFLVIGMQFDQQTVKYRHITPQGQEEERSVAEIRRVSLPTSNTHALGSRQIWGKRFSGRGPYLN